MTTLVAMLGLMPAALSHGIGSQTQKPLAIAVIGGSCILALFTRVIRPPLLVVCHEWWERWREKRGLNPDPFALNPDADEPMSMPDLGSVRDLSARNLHGGGHGGGHGSGVESSTGSTRIVTDPATLRERVFRLERENTSLKGTLGSLCIVALLLGAAAGFNSARMAASAGANSAT